MSCLSRDPCTTGLRLGQRLQQNRIFLNPAPPAQEFLIELAVHLALQRQVRLSEI